VKGDTKLVKEIEELAFFAGSRLHQGQRQDPKKVNLKTVSSPITKPLSPENTKKTFYLKQHILPAQKLFSENPKLRRIHKNKSE
jgi:hypothetical protein